jgi:hypothetical protein
MHEKTHIKVPQVIPAPCQVALEGGFCLHRVNILHRAHRVKSKFLTVLSLISFVVLLGCQDSEPTHYVERKIAAKTAQASSLMDAMKPGSSSGQLVQLPFEYLTPNNWKELDPTQNKGMRARTFDLGDSLECTFVLLGGLGGGLEQNLMRWAKQLGLNPTQQDLSVFRSTAKVLETSGDWKAELFDFRSFDKAAKETILAAILPVGNQTVFVKIQGQSRLIDKQESSLIQLIKSMKPLTPSKRGKE